METFSIEYALLAMQRALLREVIPALRAVTINLYKEQQRFYARFYYDGEVSEQRIDLWDCAITEASAALGPDCFVQSQFERLDYPQRISVEGYYAYMRKEALSFNKQMPFVYYIKIREWTVGYALLSIQRALLGVVTSALRAVVVDANAIKKSLYIRFYYDGEIDQNTIDLWKNSIAESSAEFGQDCVLDAHIERLDYPQDILCLGRYAYFRKE